MRKTQTTRRVHHMSLLPGSVADEDLAVLVSLGSVSCLMLLLVMRCAQWRGRVESL
jgi:hypothetical protein